jgi:FAD dependent oxidoreductase
MLRPLLALFIFLPFIATAQNKTLTTDVLVIGGSTGGTAAGIQCARRGINTLIVEQTTWLGGMLTAAGVSCTDGNDALPSGMWQEFRQALKQHYKGKSLATGWVSNTSFEPHVGDSIFKAWAAKEKKLSVAYGWYFDKVTKQGNKVTGAVFINTKKEKLIVKATITIDATDLGDAFAQAGCSYDLGTEDETQSGEKIAPCKSDVIQDLTWAATLQDFGAGADKTIPKPANYDATKYYCSTTEAPCNGTPYNGNNLKVLNYGKLPVTNTSNKYMLNWPAHGNDYYLNVTQLKPVDREKEYTKAKNHTLGFVYFLQTQLGMKHIGLADEFGTADKLAMMPYNREGRRVKGLVRLNINHIKDPYNYTLYRTGIAVGDYPVDQHHAQYPGKVPPIPFPKIPSYNIPLGALIPEKMDGLIVCDKGISVSNIANGTTRLQPVVLLTGQAAGMLAAECMYKSEQPRRIDVRDMHRQMLNNKCYLMPFVDVALQDDAWFSIQLAGTLGLIKGEGKSESWANKMYFYPDSLMKENELITNINNLLDTTLLSPTSNSANLSFSVLQKITTVANNFIASKATKPIIVLSAGDIPAYPSNEAVLTRKQIAFWLMEFLNEVYLAVDIHGKVYIR